MPLSWNEIRHRAIAFSKEWTGVKREQAEKQTFWNEFFNVFGIPRRAVASFEEPVKNISGEYGYIDLFWPGKVLVEHKSRGKDLSKAESQAFRYILDLAREGRSERKEHETCPSTLTNLNHGKQILAAQLISLTSGS